MSRLTNQNKIIQAWFKACIKWIEKLQYTKTFCLSIFSTGLYLIASTIFHRRYFGRVLYATFQIEVRSIELGWRTTDVETEDSEFDSLSRVLFRQKGEIVAEITISVFDSGIYIAAFTVIEKCTSRRGLRQRTRSAAFLSRGESIITKIGLLSCLISSVIITL